MRVMIIVRGNASSESGVQLDDHVEAAMARYHQDLARAGVLLDTNGLQPSRAGWRIHCGADGQRRVLDGPFPDSPEPMAGYTLIQVRSRDEAMEWSRRFPAPCGDGQACEIEVRPVVERDDGDPFAAVQPLCQRGTDRR